MNIAWHQVDPTTPSTLFADRWSTPSEAPTIAGVHTGSWVSSQRGRRVYPVQGPVPPGGAAPSVRGRSTGALADVAVFAFGAANEISLNYAIRRELRAHDREARRAMDNHRTGGILAVAMVVATHDPSSVLVVEGHPPVVNRGPTSRLLSALWIEPRVYAQPAHAIWAFRERRRSGGALEPNGGRYSFNETIFFFGVWDGVYQAGRAA